MKYGEKYPHWGWCWRCGREVRLLGPIRGRLLQLSLRHGSRSQMFLIRYFGIEMTRAAFWAFLPTFLLHAAMTGVWYRVWWQVPIDGAFHLLRHRTDELGPPCKACGKLLRTQLAKFCAACGAERR